MSSCRGLRWCQRAGLTIWCQYNKGKCERSLGVAPHYSQLQRHEERDKEGLYDLVLTQIAQREQRRTSSCEANDSLTADVNVDLYCFQSLIASIRLDCQGLETFHFSHCHCRVNLNHIGEKKVSKFLLLVS